MSQPTVHRDLGDTNVSPAETSAAPVESGSYDQTGAGGDRSDSENGDLGDTNVSPTAYSTIVIDPPSNTSSVTTTSPIEHVPRGDPARHLSTTAN